MSYGDAQSDLQKLVVDYLVSKEKTKSAVTGAESETQDLVAVIKRVVDNAIEYALTELMFEHDVKVAAGTSFKEVITSMVKSRAVDAKSCVQELEITLAEEQKKVEKLTAEIEVVQQNRLTLIQEKFQTDQELAEEARRKYAKEYLRLEGVVRRKQEKCEDRKADIEDAVARLEELNAKLERAESNMRERETIVKASEAAIVQREEQQAARNREQWQTFQQQEAQLNTKQREMDQRVADLDRREQEIDERQRELELRSGERRVLPGQSATVRRKIRLGVGESKSKAKSKGKKGKGGLNS